MEQPPPPDAPSHQEPPAVQPASALQTVAPVPAGQQGRYSADGFWWWDGASWQPAYSQDRLWRWNGQSWVPAAGPPPPGAGGGAGLAIGLGVGLFVLVIVMVVVIVLVVLGTMGDQIANLLSNVAAALASPSP
jgi:hypothetical protein